MSKHMSKKEKEKREKIVKGMKKGDGEEFEKRYPGRGKEVMYATATKQAMKEDVVAYYKNILVEFIFRENDPRTKLLSDGSHEIDPRGFGSGKIISKEELARRYEEEYNSPRRVGGKLSSPEEISQYNERMDKRWKEEFREFKQREEMRKKAKEELDPNFVGPPSPETQEYVENQKNPLRATLPPPDERRVVGPAELVRELRDRELRDSPEVVERRAREGITRAQQEIIKKAKEELDPNFVGPPSPEVQKYVEDQESVNRFFGNLKKEKEKWNPPPEMDKTIRPIWAAKSRQEIVKKAKEELDPNFVGPPSPETQKYVEDQKNPIRTLPSYGSGPSSNSKSSSNSNRIFPFKDPRRMKK